MDERIVEIQEHYGLETQTAKCIEELDELKIKIVLEVEKMSNAKICRTIPRISAEEK